MKGCSRAPAPPIGQLMPRRPGSAVAVCGTRSRRVASAFGVERRDAQHGVEGVAATGGQRLRLRLLDDARLHPARGGMGGRDGPAPSPAPDRGVPGWLGIRNSPRHCRNRSPSIPSTPKPLSSAEAFAALSSDAASTRSAARSPQRSRRLSRGTLQGCGGCANPSGPWRWPAGTDVGSTHARLDEPERLDKQP